VGVAEENFEGAFVGGGHKFMELPHNENQQCQKMN
jgi:hypothetical protein